MNVLESLHLVSRVAKNQYGWHGRHSLPKTLRNLQRLGEEQKYEEQMAYLQQKELDLMDYKFGERKRDGCPESQDPQLLDFSEPDYPSCESTVPTRVMAGRGRWCLLKRVTAKMGGTKWTTLEGDVLLFSLLKTGRQMASRLGCPLNLTEKLCSGSFTWYLVCLDRRARTALPFQIDSPMLIPACEPLRKIYLERISLSKGSYLFNYILE